MATVKFFIRTKFSNAKISLRFFEGKTIDLKKVTRETVNHAFWNEAKGRPKNLKTLTEKDRKELSELTNRLDEIEVFILEQFRKRDNDEIINAEWLTEIINAYYSGGRLSEKLDFLLDYLEYYETKILPFRKSRGTPISRRTKLKQFTVINKLRAFLGTINRNFRVSDYGEAMGNEFVTYLRDVENLNENTVGKYLKYSKTIIKEAQKINIETHANLEDIKGFTVDTPTVVFTPQELQAIKDLSFLNKRW